MDRATRPEFGKVFPSDFLYAPEFSLHASRFSQVENSDAAQFMRTERVAVIESSPDAEETVKKGVWGQFGKLASAVGSLLF